MQSLREGPGRDDGCRLQATAEHVTTTAVTLQRKLRERAVSTGSGQQADTANTVALERRAGPWKVTAFTTQP